uniref:Hsp90 co-chaperone Cdc37 n=1 Tax=Strigamia maritima TaxID=126957 RepID=T1JMF2_STRMM
MAETEKEKEVLVKGKTETQKKIQELSKKLNDDVPDVSKLKIELSDLEKQKQEFLKKEEELSKKEKLAPWNVDTISKEGFTKTVINKGKPRKEEDLTEEERDDKYRQFVKENEKLVKKYGMLQKFDDSKRFLQDNPHLACEDTANFLVVWCVQLAMEEKIELMDHVAHQTICMQYILELAKQLEVDPRSCVSSFFTRIQTAEKSYIDAFQDELSSFKQRVRTRAQVRLEKLMKEAEEEERKERLGPGGLDPVEVFESLPPALQKCFEERDIAMLQEEIAKMPEAEACVIMKRCVDSGLWVPDAKQAEAMAAAAASKEMAEK